LRGVYACLAARNSIEANGKVDRVGKRGEPRLLLQHSPALAMSGWMDEPIIVHQCRQVGRKPLLVPIAVSVTAHLGLLLVVLSSLLGPQNSAPAEVPVDEPCRAIMCGLSGDDAVAEPLVQVALNRRPVKVYEIEMPNEGSVAVSEGSGAHPAGSAAGNTTPARGNGSGTAGGQGPASWLKAPRRARSIVYLIDCSLSMGEFGALDTARDEIARSVDGLDQACRIQVFVYDLRPQPLLSTDATGLVAPTTNVRQVMEGALARQRPRSGTNHFKAIQAALQLRPDVVFLVTDEVTPDEDLTADDVRRLQQMNGAKSAVHVVELLASRRAPLQQGGGLRRLADQSGGAYRTLLLSHSSQGL
jgi:hypothetical protein